MGEIKVDSVLFHLATKQHIAEGFHGIAATVA